MLHYGIHWFRRDLRVAGNSALKWNWKKTQGRTLGVFFFDSQFLSRSDFSHHRFAFFLESLRALQLELRELGGDLLVLDHGPDQGFEALIKMLGALHPQWVTFNRDYEPFARDRDARLTRQIEGFGITVHTERDHLLIEPHELQKNPGEPSFYQVYSPFCRKWLSMIEQDGFQSRLTEQKEALAYLDQRRRGEQIEPFFRLTWEKLRAEIRSEQFVLEDCLEKFVETNQAQVKIPIPQAGSLKAYQDLCAFREKVDCYLDQRDFPSLGGTSRMSLYLKNGSISPALILAGLHLNEFEFKKKSGKIQYLKEVIWREFYYHILFHRPSVETEAFLPRYRNLKWQNNPQFFEAWMEGKTGFPIVDAGMRQLKTTGWMHNRVRMIVASFLTKDLLVDWKWGEKYFMNQLLDGDLAPNNGGWQWAASTGCDPQPYFRIFNPLLQSEKFDPKGEYIKKYVPELKGIHSDFIHEPSLLYLTPIVNHAEQKEKALALYRG